MKKVLLVWAIGIALTACSDSNDPYARFFVDSPYADIFDGSNTDAIAPIQCEQSAILNQSGSGIGTVLGKEGPNLWDYDTPERAYAKLFNEYTDSMSVFPVDIDFENNSLIIGLYKSRSSDYRLLDQRVVVGNGFVNLYLRLGCGDSEGGFCVLGVESFAAIYPNLPDLPLNVIVEESL